jgi:rsbT co-antagonist protein RsbR
MSAGQPPDQELHDWYSFFEQCPLAMQVFHLDGTLVAVNQAAMQLWGVSLETAGVGTFNLLQEPQVAEQQALPFIHRAIQGETVQTPFLRFDPRRAGLGQDKEKWFQTTYFPLRDKHGTITHFGAVARDVLAEVQQQQAIETAQQEIEAQREMISELSSPVVKVWEGILTVPLVGVIDARRATTITESLLEAIVQHQAERVILDITGVATVDTQVANYLVSAASACRLLGSEVALVGIGSEIAQTLVHLGVDLSTLVTRADLQAGLAWAFERQKLAVSSVAEQRPSQQPALSTS